MELFEGDIVQSLVIHGDFVFKGWYSKNIAILESEKEHLGFIKGNFYEYIKNITVDERKYYSLYHRDNIKFTRRNNQEEILLF